MNQPTREELIALCDRAIVPADKWRNRDSAAAHLQIGQAWALLKAGCEYEIEEQDSRMIWLVLEWAGFTAFEYGEEDGENLDSDRFYIPTSDRLDKCEGRDWYC